MVSSSIGMNCSIGGAKVGSSTSLKSQTGAVNGSHFSERASLTESSVDIYSPPREDVENPSLWAFCAHVKL